MSTTKEQNAGSSKIYELHWPSFRAPFWVVFDMKVEMFLVKVWFDILDFNNVLLKHLNICNYSVITLYFLTWDRFSWAGFVWQRHGSAVLEPKLTAKHCFSWQKFQDYSSLFITSGTGKAIAARCLMPSEGAVLLSEVQRSMAWATVLHCTEMDTIA